MNRIRKWWKPAVAFVLLLAALQIGGSLLVRTGRVHRYLIAQLSRSFGRPVDVQKFSASVFPSPTLEAEGVTVGEDPAFGNEYFLRADRLSTGLRWFGLLRGRFEFGTLALNRPSLILARNSENRWNLERWLPAGTAAQSYLQSSYGAASAAPVSNRLQRITVDEGRLNFKFDDDKAAFAFTNVSGSIEQIGSGRWQLQLEATPWRSGVQLQSTGTVRVHGDVAGTSSRLQPAHVQVSWAEVSLADFFRLILGQDHGVRGSLSAELVADSGTAKSSPNSQPGVWNVSLRADASQIHRWDLTERKDNPALVMKSNGHWNPDAGTFVADVLSVETRGSNLRGSGSFAQKPSAAFQARIDSAGIQASDLLAWLHAFYPDVSDDVKADQYFTGTLALRGWPVRLESAAFSSAGGRISVPSLKNPLRVSQIRGGLEGQKLSAEPILLTLDAASTRDSARKVASPPKKSQPLVPSNSVAIKFIHSLDSHTGNLTFDGRVDRIQDADAVAAAFGKQLSAGWEWNSELVANLRRDWGSPNATGWSGQVLFENGMLQLAGLNQPVSVQNARLEFRNNRRSVKIAGVNAFGGNWSGEISENSLGTAENLLRWYFELHADHLDAAELDRWMGPRARPGWLQRLLPALLGGGQTAAPSELLRRISAEGELRVDEFSVEKIKLKQLRMEGTLQNLKLNISRSDAQWAGGTVHARVAAEFSPTAKYDVHAELDRINLAQLPFAGHLSDRAAGLASGTLRIQSEGVGRESLIEKLRGEGDLKLQHVEFRGWDVAASLSGGALHAGASRWPEGEIKFHIGDRSFDVNMLRLTGPQDQVSLKGSLSFTREADLTVEGNSRVKKVKAPAPEHVLQISGPLDGPRFSFATLSQQPGD